MNERKERMKGKKDIMKERQVHVRNEEGGRERGGKTQFGTRT